MDAFEEGSRLTSLSEIPGPEGLPLFVLAQGIGAAHAHVTWIKSRLS